MSRAKSPASVLMLAACPFPTGQGTQVVIRHLATALTKAGHHVELVTYADGDLDPALPFTVHRTTLSLASQRSGPRWRKLPLDAELFTLARRLAPRHPLLHAHNIEGLLLGLLLKHTTGLPLVYHAHNAMQPELPCYFETLPARLGARLAGRLLDRLPVRFADAVIVPDDNHFSYYRECGVSRSRLHTIPLGIDTRELVPPRVAPREDDWVIYAGNPDSYQNLPLLYAAMRLVQRARPRVRLLIATCHDPEVFRADLLAHGAADLASVHRYRTRAELAALLGRARVGVCPRTLWSGVPVKVMTYLAFGLSVVACGEGARGLCASHQGAVALVAPRVESFAGAILSQLDEKPRPRAEPSFEVAEQVPLYERVYAKVANGFAAPNEIV